MHRDRNCGNAWRRDRIGLRAVSDDSWCSDGGSEGWNRLGLSADWAVSLIQGPRKRYFEASHSMKATKIISRAQH